MPKNKAYIILEVTDKGTVTVRKFDKETEKAFDRMKQNAEKASTGMGGSLQKLKQHWLAVTAAIAGTVLAIGKIMKKYAEWEISLIDMKKVTTESLSAIKTKIMGLAPALGTATDLVKGYYQVISAGVKHPIKSLELLVTASKTAKAAHVSQSEAIKALTKIMAGYEGEIKNVSEAADLLFAIEKEGQTTVAELVPIIGGLAKLSHDLGIAQDEMGASLALVSLTAGSTAEAATEYQGILIALMKPTEAMKDALNAMGFESAQAAIKQLGLAETLRRLKAATGGSAQQMAEMFGRVEGLKGMSALAANEFKNLGDKIDELSRKTGSSARAWDNYKKSSVSAWESLKASMGKVAIFLGEVLAPAAKDWAKYLSDAAEYWTKILSLQATTTIGALKAQRAELEAQLAAVKNQYEYGNRFSHVLKAQGHSVKEANEMYQAQIALLEKRISLIDRSIAEEKRLTVETAKGVVGVPGAPPPPPAPVPALYTPKEIEAAQIGLATLNYEMRMFQLQAEAAWAAYQEGADQATGSMEEYIEKAKARAAIEYAPPFDYEQYITGFDEISDKGTEAFDDLKNAVTGWASTFSSQLTDLIWAADMSFKKILKSFGRMITQMMIQKALVEPLLGAIFPAKAVAKGAAFDQGKMLPYARGGIIDRPTVFPMAGGAGLMGEKGPEAIMPLTRTTGGDLGVKIEGGTPNIQINLLNQGGQPLEATQKGARKESGKWVIDIVMKELRTGRSLRNMIRSTT